MNFFIIFVTVLQTNFRRLERRGKNASKDCSEQNVATSQGGSEIKVPPLEGQTDSLIQPTEDLWNKPLKPKGIHSELSCRAYILDLSAGASCAFTPILLHYMSSLCC